jgi:hypothetical protein
MMATWMHFSQVVMNMKPCLQALYWNDGSRKFYMPYLTLHPTMVNTMMYGDGSPDVSASDLDNDGDMDIVYSKVVEDKISTPNLIIKVLQFNL